MSREFSEVEESDFLVIGTGIAGLSFALEVASYGTVNIVTKKNDIDSSTNYAQGGIACVLSSEDSFDLHVKDTLEAGAGLCHRDAVELMVREGPDRIKALIDIGVKFTTARKIDSTEYDLMREGGHSVSRILHAADLTGREIEMALINAVREAPGIKIFENHIAVDLLTEHHLGMKDLRQIELHCFGAYVLDVKTGKMKRFLSKATVLCSGGVGRVYLHSTNPSIATGDGVAMAYRAGAKLANLEFMQFHPTALYNPDGDTFLISEAVRGFGARLKTVDGEEFMYKYDERAELAPRDIVARAIDAEMKKRGEKHVYLDMRHLDSSEIKSRFPNIYSTCLSYKLDITQEMIPVVPAAHYMCGGVLTDLNARTSIKGLYACGEVACTGVHGANRLASNSLLEAIVFSRRASIDAVNFVRSTEYSIPHLPLWDDSGTFNTEEWVLISHDRAEIQEIMWDYVGIIRSDLRLERAKRRILLISEEIESFYKRTKVTEGLIELRNLAAVAYLIIKSALLRKESRGLHYTTDYPERDDERWLKDTILQRS